VNQKYMYICIYPFNPPWHCWPHVF